MIKDLERKETEFMRLKRNKISVDDFELLTIIGRGAFGEVCTTSYAACAFDFITHSCSSKYRHYNRGCTFVFVVIMVRLIS